MLSSKDNSFIYSALCIINIMTYMFNLHLLLLTYQF